MFAQVAGAVDGAPAAAHVLADGAILGRQRRFLPLGQQTQQRQVDVHVKGGQRAVGIPVLIAVIIGRIPQRADLGAVVAGIVGRQQAVAVAEVVQFLVQRLVQQVFGQPPRVADQFLVQEHAAIDAKLRTGRLAAPGAQLGEQGDQLHVRKRAGRQPGQQGFQQAQATAQQRPFMRRGRDERRAVVVFHHGKKGASIGRAILPGMPDIRVFILQAAFRMQARHGRQVGRQRPAGQARAQVLARRLEQDRALRQRQAVVVAQVQLAHGVLHGAAQDGVA